MAGEKTIHDNLQCDYPRHVSPMMHLIVQNSPSSTYEVLTIDGKFCDATGSINMQAFKS